MKKEKENSKKSQSEAQSEIQRKISESGVLDKLFFDFKIEGIIIATGDKKSQN
jgi:hypothetical protein